MPGAHEVLIQLERNGVPKAIATSSRAEYVRRILQPRQLLERFEFGEDRGVIPICLRQNI